MILPRRTPPAHRRRLLVGAEPLAGGGTHFRVWAPGREVSLHVEGAAGAQPLTSDGEGYAEGFAPTVGPGSRYGFRLDGGPPLPDPTSRWQPDGPDGLSVVIDPAAFAWTDRAWRGVERDAGSGPVIYELHVGTFTPEGTWDAAAARLPDLRDLGITVVEVMPVADFPGRFGWGYDGVMLFAPYHGYGDPDAMRRFVDAAHRVGLGVILDVVYNHLGPVGCCLREYAAEYFSATHKTEWGDTLNFDGPGSEHVRAWTLANVRHWIEEYHLDGFRFDATQELHDTGPDHILHALAREARSAGGDRSLLLVAENEPQNAALVRASDEGGAGLDLIGNEDFHHAAVVALTGRAEGYYSNHRGTPQELISAVTRGFLYQGQWYGWQSKRRGTPLGSLPLRALAHFLENHDQVANAPGSARLLGLTSPGRWRALVTLQLLGPQTPLLFQGQEFASSAPFHYFSDQDDELAGATRAGRLEFLSQFRDLATPEAAVLFADPADATTFESSRLDWSERERNAWAVRLHRDLLALRAEDEVFAAAVACTIAGAVLADDAFALRWSPSDPATAAHGPERLLLVNLGRDVRLAPAPEPLLAPPPERYWTLVWSSQDPRYGGCGTPPVETDSWNLPSGSALVLGPGPAGAPDPIRT